MLFGPKTRKKPTHGGSSAGSQAHSVGMTIAVSLALI